MFLDEASVEFISGKGGSGAVSFHREKHVPRGGPNGADGGRGGDVVLIADRGRRTLYDFKLQSRFEAENGSHGMGNKRGKDGKGIELRIPVGTIVTDVETGDVLVDLNSHGMKFAICRGGKGGFGNSHYTSSVRQAPNFAQKGAPGEHVTAKLELKLLADIGLIGMPNAGKSTLISQISAAKPKIADYPFTTIVPNLGVVRHMNDTFVVADMPGLIAGASLGVGLGHQFLKHVERTKVLVHVVDCFPIDESDPIANYEMIENELKLYSEGIWSRPRIVALNKIDLVSPDAVEALMVRLAVYEKPLFAISAATQQGMAPLIHSMATTLEATMVEPDIPVLMPALHANEDLRWDVERHDDGWKIVGKRLSRMVAMTDLENDDAVRYLHRRLERIGVIDRLRQLGAQEGDDVELGNFVFTFTDEQ